MKIVKRILLTAAVLALTAALVLTGIAFTGVNWHYFLDLRGGAQPYPNHRGELTRMAEGVRIETREPGEYAEFSSDRELIRAEGFTPIELDRRSLWGCWSYEAFVAEYGEYHVDMGNNAFQPGWFTTDGYLITLWFGGGEKAHPLCISNIGLVDVFDLLAE